MKQVAAAAGLVVALAGVVGGVAYAQTREPAQAPARMVVVPEAQPAVTGTPTVAASPSAVPVIKTVTPKLAAPKAAPVKAAPVKRAPVKTVAPVSSKKATVKKAATTSRSFAVASDPTPVDPTPAAPKPEPSKPAYTVPRPPLPPGQTEAPNLPDDPAPTQTN